MKVKFTILGEPAGKGRPRFRSVGPYVKTYTPEKTASYIIGFAVESSFDNELACQQLRSLWTAYCFHWGLDVDTASYDADLAAVWREIAQLEEDTAYWSDFDSFDSFMCAELV